MLVKEEQAGSVLVDRVASAAAEQEVGAEAALLVGNGLRVLSVQLNLLPGKYPPLEVGQKSAAFIDVEYNGSSIT